MKIKREIYRQYVALVRAREGIGTVTDIALAHGVTRQRMYQIVREVEEGFQQAARQREENNNGKVEAKKISQKTPAAQSR